MNIFVTSPCPFESARNLDDKRVVKMCLETAQMLSTVIHKYDPNYHAEHGLYKPTHANHPCVTWAAENLSNYAWLLQHFAALATEYTARYDKCHASSKLYIKFANWLTAQTGDDTVEAPSSFQNCARNKEHGVDYTEEADTIWAYQLYLAARWETDKRAPTWYGVGR